MRRKSSSSARLKTLHRVVEQDEREPICVIFFKWALIVVGTVMLGAVIFIMGDVIVRWAAKAMEDAANDYRAAKTALNDTLSAMNETEEEETTTISSLSS